MNELPLHEITREDVRTYNEDGVICLREMFDPEWIESLRLALERILSTPQTGPLANEYGKGEDGPRYHGNAFIWREHPEMESFVFKSAAGAIAAKIMGSAKVNFNHDHILIMEPNSAAATPWHQDQPVFPIAGDQLCSLWLPLDEVTTLNGGVEYLRGSHRWGKSYRVQSLSGNDWFDDPDLEQIPDFESQRSDLDIISFEIEPGDVTVHHGLTVHGSPGNSSDKTRRRALATRWTGDDASYAPGKYKLMTIDPGINAGEPMDCDAFPRVWPRSAD